MRMSSFLEGVVRVATGRRNHFYEPRQGHPDKNGVSHLGVRNPDRKRRARALN